MVTVSKPPYWTASMVRDLPDDGNRYECIDGELLVTPGAARPLTIDLPAFFDDVPDYLRAQ